jgi:hypothetical protein
LSLCGQEGSPVIIEHLDDYESDVDNNGEEEMIGIKVQL